MHCIALNSNAFQCILMHSNALHCTTGTSDYKYGIKLTNDNNGKASIMLNARNEHDRSKFVEDLKEAILEVAAVVVVVVAVVVW